MENRARSELFRPVALLLAGLWLLAGAPVVGAEPEKARDRPPPPPAGNDPRLKTPPPVPEAGTLAERAALLVQALREDRPELADPFFFPREPFRQVKGIANPDRYFDKLIRLYHEDLRTLRATLKHPETVELVSFELGRARRWIPRGKEANALPYWAAYRTTVTVKDGEKVKPLPVRVMITWDGQWYCTHLTRMK